MPGPCGDRVVDPLVGLPRALAGEDPHGGPARPLRASRSGCHHVSEAAADDDAARLREQSANLLGLADPLGTAPDDGDLRHEPMIGLGRKP